MVKTYSSMVPIGTPAPDFSLLDVCTQQIVRLNEHVKHSKGTLVMFICNHCPYVKYILPELVKLAHDYKDKPISIIAINSNNYEDYPEDSPENMKLAAQKWNFTFPYLFDETQEVAQTFQATCTPDFFLYDDNLHLVYRGQFDDSRPGNQIPTTGHDLRHALNCMLTRMPNQTEQKPSMGCNIKWKVS
jgi:thiol-disulfide isomerase/thioredoxin